jgi:hypothetical protein
MNFTRLVNPYNQNLKIISKKWNHDDLIAFHNSSRTITNTIELHKMKTDFMYHTKYFIFKN